MAKGRSRQRPAAPVEPSATDISRPIEDVASYANTSRLNDGQAATVDGDNAMKVGAASAREWHEEWGQARAALEAYQAHWTVGDKDSNKLNSDGEDSVTEQDRLHSIAREHNRTILTHLAQASEQRAIGMIQDESSSSRSTAKSNDIDLVVHLAALKDVQMMNLRQSQKATTAATTPKEELALVSYSYSSIPHLMLISYNLGLSLLSAGKPREAAEALLPSFCSVVLDDATSSNNEQHPMTGSMQAQLHVSVQMAFLLLDCMIRLGSGCHVDHETATKNLDLDVCTFAHPAGPKNGEPPITPDVVLDWIATYLDRRVQQEKQSGHHHTRHKHNQEENVVASFVDPMWAQQEALYASDLESATEFKFRLSLYRATISFLKVTSLSCDSTSSSQHIRAAKKELKTAFELYTHKLVLGHQDDAKNNPHASTISKSNTNDDEDGGTLSVAAGSLGSGSEQNSTAQGNNPIATTTISLDHKDVPDAASSQSMSPQTPWKPEQVRRLEGQHQCALYSKAHMEHLKNNAKKSLKLCAEARHVGNRRRQRPGSSSSGYKVEGGRGDNDTIMEQRAKALDEALYFNNLGVLHQSSGKCHVAMHYYSQAIACLEKVPSLSSLTSASLDANGTIAPVPTSDILHNASICAFQQRNFAMAYECMAKAVRQSPLQYALRPRCWFRMAEACLGLYQQHKMSCTGLDNSLHKIVSNPGGDGAAGIWISNKDNGQGVEDIGDFYKHGNELSRNLGSPRDMQQLKDTPLLRAMSCLQMAHRLLHSRTQTDDKENTEHVIVSIDDKDCLLTTRLAMAYVHLEWSDYVLALRMSRLVLGDIADWKDTENTKAHLIRLRQAATAKLYACEALCAMGNPTEAMEMLQQNDADKSEAKKDENASLARLASDLAMNSDNYSATQSRRLEKALEGVHISASGAAAAAGNLVLAKKHAMHASSICTTVESRRAMLYCMMKEGNHEGALALIRSAH